MARSKDRNDRPEDWQQHRDWNAGAGVEDGWNTRRRFEESQDQYARRQSQQGGQEGMRPHERDQDPDRRYQDDGEHGGYGRGYGQTESGAGARGGQRAYDENGGRNEWSGGRGGNRERGFMDRAGDEVSSWFGDDDARRRRNMDGHRGKGPKGYTRSDDRICEDANDRLGDDDGVDASDIEVSVQGGEVTLTGEVATREEKRMAEDCVERVAGVTHVQNNLRVTSNSRREGEGVGKSIPHGGTSTTTTI